jgi:hypothetical protein
MVSGHVDEELSDFGPADFIRQLRLRADNAFVDPHLMAGLHIDDSG